MKLDGPILQAIYCLDNLQIIGEQPAIIQAFISSKT